MTDDVSNLTPQEKKRAQNKAWRERNIEKARESGRRSMRKYKELHPEEARARARESARKYYQKHREKILERQRIYVQQHREKIYAAHKAYAIKHPEKRKQWCDNYAAKHADKLREYKRKYQRTHREKIAEIWRRHAAQVSAQRKAEYAANPQPARDRAKIYYDRAMASREMAKNVCPAFRFLLANPAAYRILKASYYAFVQRAISCPALSAADASLCPMVANTQIKRDQMLETCTMPKVFDTAGAWTGVRAQAMALRKQR